MTNHWGKCPSLSRFFLGKIWAALLATIPRPLTLCGLFVMLLGFSINQTWRLVGGEGGTSQKRGRKGVVATVGVVLLGVFLLENKHGKISQGFGKKRSR